MTAVSRCHRGTPGMSVVVNLFRASVSSSAPWRQPPALAQLTTDVGSKPMTYKIKPLRGDTQMPRLSWCAALAAMALAAPAGAVLAQSAALGPQARKERVMRRLLRCGLALVLVMAALPTGDRTAHAADSILTEILRRG